MSLALPFTVRETHLAAASFLFLRRVLENGTVVVDSAYNKPHVLSCQTGKTAKKGFLLVQTPGVFGEMG